MTFAEFKQSLAKRTPPEELSPALAALWWAGKDQWDKAHTLVMDEDGKDCARVHAYLHRLEKDLENARYWYRRAAFRRRVGRSRRNGAQLCAISCIRHP
jgi:hypothetical protein